MSICQSIFQKTIHQLELQDVVSFFSTSQEETSVLEFKSGSVELEQVYREISAFLNTEGGLLIIGSPKESTIGKKKVSMGDLDPALKIINKDSLIRSVASNISPSPAGIKITSFDFGAGKIFVLDIPQSFDPPHQASQEGKYYIRFGTEAKPAPHGIVEALFNKRQKARLVGDIRFAIRRKPKTVNISFTLENASLISAEFVGVLIEIVGVKNVMKSKNINIELSFKDDMFRFQQVFNNNLLVRGIKMDFELEIESRSDFFCCSFSYYCKDSKLESIKKVFSINEQKSLKIFSSSDNESELSDSLQVYELYSEMKEKELLAVFKSIDKPKMKAEQEEIMDLLGQLSAEHGIEFPTSYISFLSVCGGFGGEIQGRRVHMFSIKELHETICLSINESKNSLLLIGEIDDNPVWINFEDPEEIMFRWSVISGGAGAPQDRMSQSFLDLIEDLQSS